jgi:hypothetical protein
LLQRDGKDPAQIGPLFSGQGGSGTTRQAIEQHLLAMRQTKSEIAKNDAITAQDTADTQVKQDDATRGKIMSIVANPDPAARQAQWAQELANERAAGRQIPPGITDQYPGDHPALLLANQLALGSRLQEEETARQKVALDAWKPAGGQLQNVISGETIGGLNGPKIALLNRALETRWQVLNPGQSLPDQFKLQPNASPHDFDNLDKVLEATERAKGTVAQQEQTNAIRAQTFELARDKADMKPVMGQDPKTGQTVLVPMSQAQSMGLQNAVQASDDATNKAFAARHWLTLATKPAPAGAAPEDMSISQLIDNLDKAGKLGPLASRWNEFMAGKVGAGDPYVEALRAKMGLPTTLLMQAHVGNRGSAQMLEHFEDLANQKKLDGPTLRTSFNSEINYVRDRSMDPNPPNYGAQGATAPVNVASLPRGNGRTIDRATAQQFYQAAGNDPDKARQLATQSGWQVPKAQQMGNDIFSQIHAAATAQAPPPSGDVFSQIHAENQTTNPAAQPGAYLARAAQS